MFKLIFLTIGILGMILWIKAIIEIITHEFRGNDKIVWLLLVVLIPFIGTILYYLIGQNQKIEKIDEFV